jgi:hypothetical protein
MGRSDRAEDPEEVTNPVFACWCGERGTYDELFDPSGLEEACGGTGVIHCFCGGDFCVCHHHGGAGCPGCEDCDLGEVDFDPEADYADDEEDEPEADHGRAY